MKTCANCRWRPDHWAVDLHHPDRVIGDCRAPVPFWLAEALAYLAAPLETDADDYRGLTRPRDGENITGVWAGDFSDCAAWESRRMQKRKGNAAYRVDEGGLPARDCTRTTKAHKVPTPNFDRA